jgi:hypothetical protein
MMTQACIYITKAEEKEAKRCAAGETNTGTQTHTDRWLLGSGVCVYRERPLRISHTNSKGFSSEGHKVSKFVTKEEPALIVCVCVCDGWIDKKGASRYWDDDGNVHESDCTKLCLIFLLSVCVSVCVV